MSNNKKPTNINNVYEVDYSQEGNSEVQLNLPMYYTDLDPLAKAQLFQNTGEASSYVSRLYSYFPTACIELYSVYYTLSNATKKDGKMEYEITPRVVKLIPAGTVASEGNSAAANRKVSKKHLNELYTSVDYIRILRPTNGVKWYEVSKKELSEYLAIIRSFYGITNFPDKTGDYVYSKKVNKWLATDKLDDLIDSGLVTIDFNNVSKGTVKIVSETTLWDRIVAFFKTLGKKLFGWIPLFNQKTWDNIIDGIFANDFIKKIQETSKEDLLNASSAFWKSWKTSNLFKGDEAQEFANNVKKFLGIDIGKAIDDTKKFLQDVAKGLGVNPKNNVFNLADLQKGHDNMIKKLKELTGDSSSGILAVTKYIDNYKNKIKSAFQSKATGIFKGVWDFIAQILKNLGINV